MALRSAALVVMLVLAFPTRSAWAQAESLSGHEDVQALEFDWARDLAITGSALAAWGLSEAAFKSSLAPETCRWCTPLDSLNGFDDFGRRARWGDGDVGKARNLSNIVLVSLPVAVVGSEFLVTRKRADLRVFAADALIITESVALAGALNQAVKFSVGRERPFVAALPDAAKPFTDRPDDNNLSFYSGHTNFAFSLVVSAGTVATLRGYPHRWAVWSVGLPLAASVGYFRMAADKHYLSDVLVGAAMGSAIGAAVPLLLHERLGWEVGDLRLRVTPQGQGLAVNGTF